MGEAWLIWSCGPFAPSLLEESRHGTQHTWVLSVFYAWAWLSLFYRNSLREVMLVIQVPIQWGTFRIKLEMWHWCSSFWTCPSLSPTHGKSLAPREIPRAAITNSNKQQGLKQQKFIHSLTFLESTSSKSRCWWGHAPPESFQGRILLSHLQVLLSPWVSWSLSGCIIPISASIFTCLLLLWLSCAVCVLTFSYKSICHWI